MIRYDIWYDDIIYMIWYDIYDMMIWYGTIYDMIYLLTAIGLTSGGSSTLYIYTQTIHRTIQLTNWEECGGPCPVFASYTLAFTLQLRKKSTEKHQSG